MKINLFVSTLILAVSCGQFAFASNSIFVDGAKASRIYRALQAAGASPADGLIEVTTVYCRLVSVKNLTPFSTCELQGTKAYDRGDYVGGKVTDELIASLQSVRIAVSNPQKESNAVVRVLETGKITCDNQERIVRDETDQSGQIVHEFTCQVGK
jgi:hypothetical protein